MYRIETHLHTTYISRCGWLGAEAIMKYYTACGYDAICVTDHYNRECFDYAEIDLTTPGSKTQAFLQGYHRLKKVSEKYNIRVYAGAELRFDESDNDYLLFGFHDALLADPDRVMREGLAAFAPQYRADGALLVQAHPFRKKCTPAPAEYLDGVEVLNLIEGDAAVIESPAGAFEPFTVHYAETFIIPASIGSYTIRPLVPGTFCGTVKAYVRH